jgi:predicted TPR repeat methyltransferase
VLRDLSISLNKLGDAESEAGRGEAALQAYRESLELSRQLRQALGDGPQVLRDLSISLERVGDAEREAGRGEAALQAYRESLELRRQLRQALGDGPQVLDDLAFSLQRMSSMEARSLADRRADVEEALQLRRQLAAALPDLLRHRSQLAATEALARALAAASAG